MYIGTIPTPAATESRQEWVATAGQTVFPSTGGTVGYADLFVNGVKMASSDFTFDGADFTLTTGAAAGDVVNAIMRQADNALVALPIKDSAGNNVLSEANNVVSIDSGVKFPAGQIIGHVYGSYIYLGDASVGGTTPEVVGPVVSLTLKNANAKLYVSITYGEAYGANNSIKTIRLGYKTTSFSAGDGVNSSTAGTTLATVDSGTNFPKLRSIETNVPVHVSFSCNVSNTAGQTLYFANDILPGGDTFWHNYAGNNGSTQTMNIFEISK